MAVQFFAPANYFVAGNGTVVASWAAGDDVFVFGGTGNATDLQDTPTATGLTFSLVTSFIGAPGVDPNIWLWRATAGSAGSSVTITSTRNGHTNPVMLAAVVVPGGAASVSALTGNGTENTPYNATTPAGGIVLYAAMGFSGTAPGTTPLTGSGTATERADTGDNANYGVYIADWEGTASGTFNFGPTSYTNFGQVAQLGAVITPNAGTAEQKSFRFGNDDGSESAHTWAAAQDTNLTAALGTKLLRFLLQTTGDEPATAWKLQHQVNGAGGYADTPVGASVAEAFGTVTFGAIGTGANGTTSVAPSYPAGITAGDYLTCVVTSGGTGSPTPSTPGGWTLLATGASTDGTFGLDTGPRRCTVFGKVADGTETGTLTVSITSGDTCRGTISRWTKTGGSAWVVDGYGADDSTSGTGVSMTFASVGWHDGDAVLVATGQRVDSATQSAQSLTATGITFGTRTNRAATAVTTGNDHRHTVDTFAAVSGADPTENAAPTWAYTASAAASAGGVLVRLRAYTAPATNPVYVAPSSNITAGGEATTQQLTGGTGTFTAGRRWDDENGTDAIDVASDGNTELEWAIGLQSLTNGDFVDFRLTPIDTYTVTPRWTVGSAGVGAFPFRRRDPLRALITR